MEKKINVTINDDGSLNIEYPNDFKFMEVVGLIESSKAILLSEYVNPITEGKKPLPPYRSAFFVDSPDTGQFNQ